MVGGTGDRELTDGGTDDRGLMDGGRGCGCEGRYLRGYWLFFSYFCGKPADLSGRAHRGFIAHRGVEDRGFRLLMFLSIG